MKRIMALTHPHQQIVTVGQTQMPNRFNSVFLFERIPQLDALL
jgi:hypothetical protein